jgi:hypothetical protein
VLAYAVPGEVTLALIGALVVVVTALAVGYAQLRDRIARLEEWVRIKERGEVTSVRKVE